MKPTLPLADMTLAEKLETLDEIWADILKEEKIESPAWSAGILREREELIESGKAEFLDWEQVKKELRNEMP